MNEVNINGIFIDMELTFDTVQIYVDNTMDGDVVKVPYSRRRKCIRTTITNTSIENVYITLTIALCDTNSDVIRKVFVKFSEIMPGVAQTLMEELPVKYEKCFLQKVAIKDTIHELSKEILPERIIQNNGGNNSETETTKASIWSGKAIPLIFVGFLVFLYLFVKLLLSPFIAIIEAFSK